MNSIYTSMNKLKNLFPILILLIFTSTSCNKLEELLDVTFSTEYSVELNAIIPPSNHLKEAQGNFSASATINPNSNSDFSTYANKIKEIEITSITAKVISISKQVTIEMANISVSSGDLNTSWNFSNEVITAGKILSLGNDSNQWGKVQDILENLNTFTVFLDGTTDVDDVEFTIEVTINSKITANPLEN
jgi:hypothetical protein